MPTDASVSGSSPFPVPIVVPTGQVASDHQSDQTLVGIIPAVTDAGAAGSVADRATAADSPVARPTTPETPKSSRNHSAPASAIRQTPRLSPRLIQQLERIPLGWKRFESLQEIGRGGCGVVTAATDHQLGREVVVKRIIESGLSDEAIARFINEAEITGQLEHPGIVPVHELGTDDHGLPYYVMKRLQGVTLAQRITEYRSLPQGSEKVRLRHELLQRFLSVCHTLAFAHRRGIIHRDLKPANIMLGEFGETVVLDWGLARTIRRELSDSSAAQTLLVNRPLSSVAPRFVNQNLDLDDASHAAPSATPAANTPEKSSAKSSPKSRKSDQHKPATARSKPAALSANGKAAADSIVHRLGGSHLTMDGRVMGTAAYMAPEQALGNNELLNEQSDVFSLGVILYEILSGVSPFQSNSIEHTIEKVAHCDYRPLSQYRAGLPKPLMAICHHALQREQSDRYSQAQDLANDLQNFLAGQPVTVYGEKWWERWDRWAGSHQTLFRAIFFSAITVALVASLATGVISRSHQSEIQAKHQAVVAHEETQVALAAEQRSREQAQQRLLAARTAADRWLIDLSGSLQYYPGLAPLRQDLLQQGKLHYQSLLTQAQESTEDQSELAHCHIRLGDLARLTDEPSVAAQHYQSATTILDDQIQKMASDHPRLGVIRTQRVNAVLGLALLNLATFEVTESAQTEAAASLKRLDEARTSIQQVLTEHPESIEARNCFARLLLVAARWQVQSQSLESAAASLNDALQQADILVQQSPELRQWQLKTTILEDYLRVLKSLTQLAEAGDLAAQLILHFDRLLKTNPTRPDWLEGRSLAYSAQAEIWQRQQQPAAALNAYRQAELDLHAAWDQLLTEPFYRENQAILQANMALASELAGQREDAEQRWLTAIDDLRWLSQAQGISDDRVQRMAHCYLQLAKLQLSRNEATGRQWLDQHQVLVDHLLKNPASQRWAETAQIEQWLVAAQFPQYVEDPPTLVRQLTDCLPTQNGSVSLAGSTESSMIAERQAAQIHSAIALLVQGMPEKKMLADEHFATAMQLWQPLANTADRYQANSVYPLWLDWILTWPTDTRPTDARTSEPLPVTIAEQWASAARDHAPAWQYYAWSLAAAGRFDAAAQAAERAKHSRSGWPQLEDEAILRFAESQLGKPRSPELWKAVREQIELDPYRTPLRRWLLEQVIPAK